MALGRRLSRLAIIVFPLLSGALSGLSTAQDKDPAPEAVVAQHLRSIAAPEILAKTSSRAISGTVLVRFVQGAIGDLSGSGQFATDGHRLGIILGCNGQDYRGEHFAFDGKKVTVGRYIPGKISVLAEFINRFNGVMKDGLLGGALSMTWPLRNPEAIRSRLKYRKANLAGLPMHSLEYRPGNNLQGFKIVMYFEPESFRHVRTEYRLHISASIGKGPATSIGIEKPDSDYLLSEEFADFQEVDGMTLPHRYIIGFSSEGQTRTFLAYWTLQAEKWIHNGQIDPAVFKAIEY